ncbi:MAG: glycosyltransferase family 4 protein [Lachnospiraceae bacterium]|nr:glycosyltransferase family 4 protein [Lachnospiraceae bacterium]
MENENKVKSKTIMVVTPHTPSLTCFRLDMMNAFIAKGYKVIAVGQESESEWTPRFQKYGIDYISIPIVRNGLNAFEDLKTLKALYTIFKKVMPEKVFLYQAKAVVYGSMAARFLNIEAYSLICGLGSIFRGTSTKSKFLRQIMKVEYKFALKKNAAVIFHNPDDKDLFIKWKLAVQEKCHVVGGSGVNINQFAYTPLKGENTIFLMVGRIIRDKGVIEYLEACKLIKADYPNVKCMLVGPFDTNPSALQKPEIDNYAAYVDYYGGQEDVRPFLEKCTVFVLPSYHEGLPKSVLEAMSVGRAIITTDAPGCRNTVNEGKNGFLVPIKDSNELYEKMKYMVQNPEKQSIMGKKSREYAEEKYSVDKVNEQIMKIMKL